MPKPKLGVYGRSAQKPSKKVWALAAVSPNKNTRLTGSMPESLESRIIVTWTPPHWEENERQNSWVRNPSIHFNQVLPTSQPHIKLEPGGQLGVSSLYSIGRFLSTVLPFFFFFRAVPKFLRNAFQNITLLQICPQWMGRLRD